MHRIVLASVQYVEFWVEIWKEKSPLGGGGGGGEDDDDSELI